ncbi:Hypothetical predicted protein [Olea europaea subsp. europaea]|uniref:Uncharacterized protein n=1 Tax=Olea europaea subsp. europaea TaxID=158383 RepID=A0A8S0SFF8_OLEEU|nr:Hypothetical predicted protein [Olea europaea subsp. europaea]
MEESKFVIDDDEEEEVGEVLAETMLAGIGSSTDLPLDRTNQANRAEVLRLLIVLLSSAIYSPNTANPWLTHLLNTSDRKVALTILCSLLNTALDVSFLESFQISTTNAYKRIAALTLSTEAKQVEDLANSLPKLCSQLLNILLIASDNPPSSPVISRNPSSAGLNPLAASANSQLEKENVFRFYVAKIHRQSDYQFLTERVLAIISLAPPTQLLASGSVDGWNLTESVVLLWRLIDCNKPAQHLSRPQRRSSPIRFDQVVRLHLTKPHCGERVWFAIEQTAAWSSGREEECTADPEC